MTWRSWAPDLGAAAIVLLLGLYEASATHFLAPDSRLPLVLIAVAMATLVGLCRHLPGLALGLTWAFCALQVVTGTQLMVVELALGAVAFGTARWGSTATVVLSALSIPAAAVIAVLWIDPNVFYTALGAAGFRDLVWRTSRLNDRWQVSAALLGMAVLGVPWLAGLTLRFSARAQQSRSSQAAAEAERDQAEEIARLRRDERIKLR